MNAQPDYQIIPGRIDALAVSPPVFVDEEVIISAKESKELRRKVNSKTNLAIAIIFTLLSPVVCPLVGESVSFFTGSDNNAAWVFISLLILLSSSIVLGKAITKNNYTVSLSNLKKQKRDEKKQNYEIALLNYHGAIRARDAALQESEKEARKLSSQLNNILSSIPSYIDNLNVALQYAHEWLEQAIIEFSENAYSPFWDAIESTVMQFAYYYDQLLNFQQTAQFYNNTLHGREHNFPEFPVRIEMIPNPEPTFHEFRTVVRMGQTDFKFANIWEHRKTQNILIAGFSTLGDAVSSLSDSITKLYRMFGKGENP